MQQLKVLKDNWDPTARARVSGRVVAVRGPVVLAKIPHVALGDLCSIKLRSGAILPAQVISFEEDTVRLAPFDDCNGLCPGAEVVTTSASLTIPVSDDLQGNVIDALGVVLEGNLKAKKALDNSLPDSSANPEQKGEVQMSLYGAPPDALQRAAIDEQLETGIRSIDGLCSLAYGQRVGLFAGAGVGKSTLLGMIARNSEVDVSVIALVGERGREVREFIDDCLGPEGLKKSVVVVSTSDESSVRRSLAAFTATTVAEYFRSRGKKVLLLVDSLTRVARAIREVTLAAGELPVRQGYTPSVYTQLPKLVERAGMGAVGSISAIYTVLSSAEQESDPLAEEIKSLLDGHLLLEQSVVREGIRPALNIPGSVSRLLPKLHQSKYLGVLHGLVQVLARLRKDKDILLLGGTPDAELRAAIEIEGKLKEFLNQKTHEDSPLSETLFRAQVIWQEYETLRQKYS